MGDGRGRRAETDGGPTAVDDLLDIGGDPIDDGRPRHGGVTRWRTGTGSGEHGTIPSVKIDLDESVPLHEQVAAEIRRAIADGECGPGDRLPPAVDLAAVLGVNRNTVLRALRELREETGFAGKTLERFFHLDQVNQFYEPSVNGILTSAAFAVRVPAGREPILSAEHDAMRWASPAAALEIVIWPAYRESIGRIERDLVDPDRAAWFRLDLDGRRPAG